MLIFIPILIIICILSIKFKVGARIATILICVIGCVSLIYFMYPYFKDIKNKETFQIEGVLSYEIQNGSGCLPLTSLLCFEYDNNEEYVYVSKFMYSSYNLKKGSKYRVIYYKNSHAVNSIELIE